MSRPLPGELAWYATGRFYAAPDGSLFDAGFFLHLSGIEGPLFRGEPGEGTAHFTFAAVPFRAGSLTNGDLRLALDPVGEFRVFYREEPGATFDDPSSFAVGHEIARFRRTSMVVGTSVEQGASTLVSVNVFSAIPLQTEPFDHAGRRQDLGRLLPHGVTQWGTAGGTSLTPPTGYTAAIPFVGSAINIGGSSAGVGRDRISP